MTRQAMSKSKKKSVARRRHGGQPTNAKSASRSFYSDQFTKEEQGLMAGFEGDPSLDDDIWMERVLNRRLMAHANASQLEGDGAAVELLIKLAEALAIGTGRGARLLRDKRVLSGDAAKTMIDAITYGLQEMNRTKGTKL